MVETSYKNRTKNKSHCIFYSNHNHHRLIQSENDGIPDCSTSNSTTADECVNYLV